MSHTIPHSEETKRKISEAKKGTPSPFKIDPAIRRTRRLAYQKAYRDANPSKNLEWRHKNPQAQMIIQARKRAKQKGIPFDIMEDDFDLPKKCPVFKSVLQYGLTKQTDNSPTLDRIVPSLGYVKGNVRVISWRANRIKSDATLNEIRQVANYMKSVTK